MPGILNNLDLVNRSHMLASGLVSWHLALPHYSSTQKWPDAGLAQNTGLFTAATWATSTRPGGFGGCVKFNGTSAFVAASSILLPVGSGVPITVAFWCLSTNLSGFRTPYFYGGAGTTGRGLLFAQDGGSNDGTIDVGLIGSNFISSTKKLVVNTWTHLCLTYDGTTAKLYFNALLDSTATPTINPPGAGSLNYGTYDQASQFWVGSLDDIRTYWRGLSGSEVKELYGNSVAGCPGLLNFVQPELFSQTPPPVVLTPTVMPGFSAGPPVRSPWFRITTPPLQAPPRQGVATNTQPLPGFTAGPPMQGTPWFKPVQAFQHVQAPPPLPATMPSVPGFSAGPPMPGAPWIRAAPAAYQISQGIQIVQTPSSPGCPGFTTGPPMPGAPWFSIPSLPFGNPGTKPTPPPPAKAGTTGSLVQRDPTQKPALRRFTEVVSEIINSLYVQGILIQTGPGEWTLKGSVTTGLTGTFTSGSA